MKDFRNIIIIALCFILVYVCGLFAIQFMETGNITQSSIKVGQVWEVTYNRDNPYEENITFRNNVIGVDNGYVLYVQNGKDTLNETKRWFVILSECVENCD
jgi:hypothetical protein